MAFITLTNVIKIQSKEKPWHLEPGKELCMLETPEN